MNDQITGLLASTAAVIIVITLNHFYKSRFKGNMLRNQQRLLGIAILVISIVLALLLLR